MWQSKEAKLAQSAARKSHNLKVVSSNLTLRILIILFKNIILFYKKNNMLIE